MSKALPETRVVQPWELVHMDGQFRLVFMTRYYGEGFPVGSLEGGRGFLMTDEGTIEQSEQVSFKSSQFVKSWRIRPSPRSLEGYRHRLAKEYEYA